LTWKGEIGGSSCVNTSHVNNPALRNGGAVELR
jgi:hypothetical protein